MVSEADKTKSKTQTVYRQSISTKATRKIKAKSDGDDTIWFGLGMMGIIGWSIVIPTLLGVAIGSWIDRNYHSGYSWTLMMLILGLIVGSLNAWYWVMKETKKHKKV
ncbi:MAG: AtpZ/AtpI family protein [Syntrophomonadaceae bacterium]